MKTVAEVLSDAAKALAMRGVEDSLIEAEVLLAHAIGASRSTVLASYPEILQDGDVRVFEALLERRVRREPLAYITGHREFYGVEIACAPGALIPRPETELLVQEGVTAARRVAGSPWIADVGTGSGAVAIALGLNLPQARVVAIDRSDAALAVARANVESAGLTSRIHLLRADLLKGTGVFDVILANLPYVAEHEWRGLAPEIRDHEPEEALRAGVGGTDLNLQLLRRTAEHLRPGGVLAMEFGTGQAATILAAARCAIPEGEAHILRDAGDRDRALVLRRASEDGRG